TGPLGLKFASEHWPGTHRKAKCYPTNRRRPGARHDVHGPSVRNARRKSAWRSEGASWQNTSARPVTERNHKDTVLDTEIRSYSGTRNHGLNGLFKRAGRECKPFPRPDLPCVSLLRLLIRTTSRKRTRVPKKNRAASLAGPWQVSGRESTARPRRSHRRSSLAKVKQCVARVDVRRVHPFMLPKISPRRHTR